MIDINKMRRLAKEQEWIGRWYDAGCETLMAERNGEHEEVAHPIPIDRWFADVPLVRWQQAVAKAYRIADRERARGAKPLEMIVEAA